MRRDPDAQGECTLVVEKHIRHARLGEHEKDARHEPRDDAGGDPLSVRADAGDPEGEGRTRQAGENVHGPLADGQGQGREYEGEEAKAEVEVADPRVQLGERQTRLGRDRLVDRVQTGRAEALCGGVEHYACEVEVLAPLGPVEGVSGVCAGRRDEREVGSGGCVEEEGRARHVEVIG